MIKHYCHKMNESYLLLFFFLFFIFCFYLGFIQLVLLPHVFPSLHAGDGIMKGANDALYFHGLALELYEKMKIDGWKVWTINYRDQSPAGIAAFFYYLFIPKPVVLIPFTALIHSFSGVFLLKTMRLIFKNSRISFFVLFPFLFMPSAITWLSNFHRDSYFILGFFLVIYAQTILSLAPLSVLRIIVSTLYFASGFFLVWLARPYALDIIFVFSTFNLLYTILHKPNKLIFIAFVASLTAIILFKTLAPHGRNIGERAELINNPGHSISIFIENKFRVFAQSRNEIVSFNPGKTNLGTEIQFNTFSDVITYIPRALQIAFFAPFPNTWFKKGLDLFKKIAILEMIFSYLAYILFFFMCLKRKLKALAIPALSFSLGLILFQGLIFCNIGTLYRMRYGPIMVIVTIALSYFFSEFFLLRKNFPERSV